MNINPANWHLLVNHLPIIGSLFSILILLLGMFRRSIPIVNLSLVLLVACAVSSMIASQKPEKVLNVI